MDGTTAGRTNAAHRQEDRSQVYRYGEGQAMKTVILAGGSGGLGAAAARLVAQRGFLPVIGYRRNRERAESLAREVSGQAIEGDILQPSGRSGLIDAARRVGELYGLAVFVGDPARVPIEQASIDDLTASFQTNFGGPV